MVISICFLAGKIVPVIWYLDDHTVICNDRVAGNVELCRDSEFESTVLHG